MLWELDLIVANLASALEHLSKSWKLASVTLLHHNGCQGSSLELRNIILVVARNSHHIPG
jgi:hypothetical protein